MSLTIMRKVKFCMGHRVVGSPLCGGMHGHTYEAELVATLPERSQENAQGTSHDVPVNRFMTRFTDWVLLTMDGVFALDEDDVETSLALAHVPGQRSISLEGPPTTQVIAEFMLKQARALAGVDLDVWRMSVRTVAWPNQEEQATAVHGE